MPKDVPHFTADFGAEEFAARRARVAEAMGRAGVALLVGARTSPGFDPFRQHNDFYYLCGVEVPHAYLLLDGASATSTLYLPPRDVKHEESDGPELSADDKDFARLRTGVEEVKPLAALAADLQGKPRVFLPRSEAEGARACQDTLRRMRQQADADPMDGQPSPEALLLLRVAQLSPGAELTDLSPILQRLRLVKSPAELAVMRRAGRLSAAAVVEAMKSTRPGVYEYQLGAVAEYVFVANGSRAGGGYRPIIAAGPNIWRAHYWRNDARLKDGDWVLMDYAPDLNNYTSDIGRMWPVNGRYSPAQRELYGFVLEYHQRLLALIRPGPTPEDILAEAAEQMRAVLDRWDFSKPIYREAATRLLRSKRPLSHGVGMAVHEVAGYFGRPLEVATVFAVDPELFVPEEKLYVRCEDTVAVMPDGCENLTAAAPLAMDAVEQLMAGQGLLQRHPVLLDSGDEAPRGIRT